MRTTAALEGMNSICTLVHERGGCDEVVNVAAIYQCHAMIQAMHAHKKEEVRSNCTSNREILVQSLSSHGTRWSDNSGGTNHAETTPCQ
jgi:hypothetical protein